MPSETDRIARRDLIRVFVGASANGEDAESLAVLEYSIRKHTTRPVQIVWMKQSRDPASPFSGWDTSKWATPFSGFRWALPALCHERGRAIYTDSDVIVLADLAELWEQPIPAGKGVLAKGGGSWRLCVSLWDCERMARELPSLAQLRADASSHNACTALLKRRDLIAAFEGDWNCLDGKGYASLTDPQLKALHYTDMSCQPQLRHALPRLKAAGREHWYDGTRRKHPRPDVQALFDRYLTEAEAAGFKVSDYVPDHDPIEYRKKALTGYAGRGH